MRSRIWFAAMAVGFALAAMPVRSGEQLTPLMLARQADAVAVVEVRFRSGAPEILVERWLLGGPAEASASWLGACLPGAELLRDWQARHPAFRESQPLWRQALARKGYRSVIALRQRPEGLRPWCETESLLGEHWFSHPRHGAWQAQFDAGLEARPVRPVHSR
jgi:hypothetical protein